MKSKPDKGAKKTIPGKQKQPAFSFFDSNLLIYGLLAASVIFVFAARMHMLSFPLERDEGEYAYMGKLILDGHPPYTLSYNMKFPGTYYMYALFMALFGKSAEGIHLGLAFMIAGSMVLMFFIATNFVSRFASVIAAASFGIMGTSLNLFGQAAHATHFVNFFALLGMFFILRIYRKDQRKNILYFLSGIFFALSCICKQTGLLFLFVGVTVILANEWKISSFGILFKRLVLFGCGYLAPMAVMVLYFYFFGDFEKFWFWTVQYLSKYGEQIPASAAWAVCKRSIDFVTANYSAKGYILLWTVAIAGIPLSFVHRGSWRMKIIVASILVFSLLAVVPGFHFRNHYFINWLPAAGLFIAFFFDFLVTYFNTKFKMTWMPFAGLTLFFLLAYTGVDANKAYLFSQNPKMTCKQFYGSNPFVESLEIASFIKHNTTKEDKIAILGSEPQICFYADRYSASGYIYTYNLVEKHSYALTMQKEMIKEIEEAKPKYFIYINMTFSWLSQKGAEQHIFNWANEYVKKYKMVGIMDVAKNSVNPLLIGDQMNGFKPQTENVIYIFERIEVMK